MFYRTTHAGIMISIIHGMRICLSSKAIAKRFRIVEKFLNKI